MLFVSITLAVATLAATLIYLFFQKKFRYWKDRNVHYSEPIFPFGNFGEANFTKSISEVLADLYAESKQHPYYGIFSFCRPALLINDPKLIKQVLVSEFLSFHDRGVYVNEKDDPLAAHLVFINGTAWRNQRVKLTPVFTSGKMKMMFHTLVDIGKTLQRVLEEPAANKQIIEMKDLMGRFTIDVISSIAFGIEANSLENPESEIKKMAYKISNLSLFESMKSTLAFMTPELAKMLRLKLTPSSVEKFFLSVLQDAMTYREKNNIQRNDFLDLMIQLKNKGYVEGADDRFNNDEEPTDRTKFTFLQAAAQSFVFFIGGYETTSTTLQFTLYELSLNQKIQEAARLEVDQIFSKYGGKLTYEGMMEMQYLDRILAETLRKYPPIASLVRECTRDFQLPDSKLQLKKGEQLFISTLGLQMDPQYYPQPEIFNPDRFSPEEKAKLPPFTYLPFGDGPRNCIGNRFALMQSKIGLASLLSKYKVEISEKTVMPPRADPKQFLVIPKDGMHLRVSLR